MNKIKNNRLFLPFLLILIILIVPLAGYGFFNANKKIFLGENPKRLPRIGNKLYFYDGKNLQGTYDCKNDPCHLAKTSLIEEEPLNISSGDNYETYIYDTYAFIQDGEDIYFQNIKNNILISQVKSIVNYGGKLNKKYLIVENKEGYFGLFNTETYLFSISTRYNYIGYLDNEAEYVLVKDETGYYLIDTLNNKQTQIFNEPIYEYNSKVIITKSTVGEYKIFNFNKEDLFPEDIIDNCNIYKNYVIVLSNQTINIYNQELKSVIKTFYDEAGGILEYTLQDNILDIKLDGKDYKKINLDNNEDLA